MNTIFRFAVEEIFRRSLKHDMEPLSKSSILKTLFPTYEEIVKDTMTLKEKEILAEMKGGQG